MVPGVRVGPINAGTTHSEIQRLFPSGAVEDGDIELDEGLLRPGTLVFKGTRSETLAIFWDGKAADAHPKEIQVCFGRRRGPCRWQTAAGLHVGTTLAELETQNGKPFTIDAFGWDYGGNVHSWEQGKLSALDCNGRLVLTLDAERVRAGEYKAPLTPEETHALSQGPEVSSALPAMRKLNPNVVGMLQRFNGPDSRACVAR